jgi:hypothetical protein
MEDEVDRQQPPPDAVVESGNHAGEQEPASLTEQPAPAAEGAGDAALSAAQQEVVQQPTEPLLPAAPETDDAGQTMPRLLVGQLRQQEDEAEAQLVNEVLGERTLPPAEEVAELLEVVTRESVVKLLGERVTAASPAVLLEVWRHEVLVAHWRAFAALDEWSSQISRAWEHTEQQFGELYEQLARWLPSHPYVDEIINMADDVHSPARWFRRYLLKGERSFSKWLQPVVESEEVVVDVLALTRYATGELERALPWYVFLRWVLETEVQPDQARLVEQFGGIRALTELIREAFGERDPHEVRLLVLAAGAAGGGRLELELARRLGKEWTLHLHGTDPDALTVARSLAGAQVAFRQSQMRGELAQESSFKVSEARPYDLSGWEAGSFDVVAMVGGLHHLRLTEQKRALAEAQRVGKLALFLEPLAGEAEKMEEFCKPLVRRGEREPAQRAQLASWIRRVRGKTGEPAMLHVTGAHDASMSCLRALNREEMLRLVAASGASYTVRALDEGKLLNRPQWLAIVGSSAGG